MTLEISRRLINYLEYQKMVEVGIISSNEKVELINGEIINKMSPIGSKHAGFVNQISRVLWQAYALNAIISVQNPIVADKYSEPEPDIVVLQPREDFYKEAHPFSKDALLVIEVADSSIERDRIVKLPIYAKGKVPEYWIVDIESLLIEVYKKPSGSEYLEKQILGPQDSILLPKIDLKITASDLLL